jgi:hypothetical protein
MVEQPHSVGLDRVSRERLIREELVALERHDPDAGATERERERRTRAAQAHDDAIGIHSIRAYQSEAVGRTAEARTSGVVRRP